MLSIQRIIRIPVRPFITGVLVVLSLVQIGGISHLLWGDDEWHVTPWMLSILERQAAQEGFFVQLEGATFRLNGTFKCEAITLTSQVNPDFQIVAKNLVLSISPWRVLLAQVQLTHIHFDEWALHMPESLESTLGPIRVMRGDFMRQGAFWHAGRGRVQLGSVFLVYEGIWKAVDLEGQSQYAFAETLERFLKKAHAYSKVIALNQGIYGFVDFSVAKQNVATIHLAGRGLECEPELHFGDYEGVLRTFFDGQHTPTIELSLRADQFLYAGEFAVKKGDFFVSASVPLLDARISDLSGSFRFFGFDGFGFEWGSLVGDFRWLGEKAFWLDTAVAQEQESIEVEGAFDFETHTGELDVIGFFSPVHLYRIPVVAKIPEIDRIHFFRPPFWRLHLSIDDDLSFDKCSLFLDTGEMDLMGVLVDRLSLRAEIKDGLFRAYEMDAKGDDFAVCGLYQHDVSNNGYRFLLEGGIRPHVIDHWMLPWWSDLWERFLFKGELPVANIEIKGRWGYPQERFVFGRARVGACSYKGANIERCSLFIFSRPFYLHLYDMFIDEPTGGQALADVQWIYHPLYKEPYLTVLSAEGALSAKSLSLALGGDVASTLEPFQSATAPTFKVTGYVYGDDSPLRGRDLLDVSVSVPAPFTYYGVPVDWISFRAERRFGHTTIDALEFGLAEGRMHGFVRINTGFEPNRLNFDMELNNASYDSFLKVLPYLKNISTDVDELKDIQVVEPSTEAEELKAGVIDARISGDGHLGDYNSFIMYGDTHLRGAELGQLSIFGPLSSILQSTFLKFSKLELTELNSSFSLVGDRLELPNMTISGPTANMKGKGYYLSNTDQLNFTFSVHVLGATKIPILSQVLNFVDPVSKIFRVRLTGQFADPEWNVIFHPFGVVDSFVPHQKVAAHRLREKRQAKDKS